MTAAERLLRELAELGLMAEWERTAGQRGITPEAMVGAGWRPREARGIFRAKLARRGWSRRALDHLFRADATTDEGAEARAAELLELVGVAGLHGATSLDIVTGCRVPAAVRARDAIAIELRARGKSAREVARLLGMDEASVRRARRRASGRRAA